MKRLILGTIFAGTAVFSTVGIFFAACGSTPPVGAGGTTGGGGVGGVTVNTNPIPTSGTSGGGGSAGSGVTPTGDANCGTQTSGTSRLPADVLLVLDRSGSMNYSTTADSNCNGGGCTARWPALTAAVNSTLGTTAGSINWGLKLYSSTGNACGVNNGVEIAISATSVPQMQTLIGNTQPNGNTPTAQAITAATAYLKTVNDQNAKYILLATDGEPNCATGNNTGTNVPATITAIQAAAQAGFKVYVIGIGPSVGNLDNFAQAGGTTSYYPASSQQDLANAFAAISTAVTTCTFGLATPPPDPNNIAVYLDTNLLSNDPANGWSLSGTQTIVLNGSACDAVTAGTAKTVRVLFGCPGGPPPPPTLLF